MLFGHEHHYEVKAAQRGEGAAPFWYRFVIVLALLVVLGILIHGWRF